MKILIPFVTFCKTTCVYTYIYYYLIFLSVFIEMVHNAHYSFVSIFLYINEIIWKNSTSKLKDIGNIV